MRTDSDGAGEKLSECDPAMSRGLYAIPGNGKTVRLHHGNLDRGKKRAITPSATSNQAMAEEVRQRPGGSATGSRVAYFEFAGGRARMVMGGSGRRYFFRGRRSLVAVDARDRRAVSRTPGLREVRV
jgi:hypothetical protein